MHKAISSRRTFLGAAAACGLLAPTAFAGAAPAPVILAPTPPMGWNSWDSFATTITEAQALEVARIMADTLLPHGYTIFTVDIQWYEPNANGYDYRENAPLTIDGYGRLLPAPNRFPSATGSSGFTALAKQVHAMGLKFGVHLMRGIPRQAVDQNLPILGTAYHAQDIADKTSLCGWNHDMYGVDMTKPGAQEYYNSVFKQFGDWGIDFVKMDDIGQFKTAHYDEMEGAHKAIVASGYPIILSLSPGNGDIANAAKLQANAQMWRISGDFWDKWSALKNQFKTLADWNPYRQTGHWPDADMLPLGLVALGKRKTNFTPDEQQTLMTLWSIARSPLIFGGDLRALDAETLALLTNDEVLAVNQASSDNAPQVYKNDGDEFTLWTASATKPGVQYLALFNVEDTPKKRYAEFYTLGLGNKVRVRDLWAHKDLGVFDHQFGLELPPHGSGLYSLKRA
jgi:hypothetical protein